MEAMFWQSAMSRPVPVRTSARELKRMLPVSAVGSNRRIRCPRDARHPAVRAWFSPLMSRTRAEWVQDSRVGRINPRPVRPCGSSCMVSMPRRWSACSVSMPPALPKIRRPPCRRGEPSLTGRYRREYPARQLRCLSRPQGRPCHERLIPGCGEFDSPHPGSGQVAAAPYGA